MQSVLALNFPQARERLLGLSVVVSPLRFGTSLALTNFATKKNRTSLKLPTRLQLTTHVKHLLTLHNVSHVAREKRIVSSVPLALRADNKECHWRRGILLNQNYCTLDGAISREANKFIGCRRDMSGRVPLSGVKSSEVLFSFVSKEQSQSLAVKFYCAIGWRYFLMLTSLELESIKQAATVNCSIEDANWFRFDQWNVMTSGTTPLSLFQCETRHQIHSKVLIAN